MESKLKKPKMQTSIMVAMGIALILSLSYIAFDYLTKQQTSIYQQGYQQGVVYGYQRAVLQLLNQASTCKSVPVTANNVTLNLIATECLQQAPANK